MPIPFLAASRGGLRARLGLASAGAAPPSEPMAQTGEPCSSRVQITRCTLYTIDSLHLRVRLACNSNQNAITCPAVSVPFLSIFIRVGCSVPARDTVLSPGSPCHCCTRIACPGASRKPASSTCGSVHDRLRGRVAASASPSSVRCDADVGDPADGDTYINDWLADYTRRKFHRADNFFLMIV